MSFINWMFGKSKFEKEQERLKKQREDKLDAVIEGFPELVANIKILNKVIGEGKDPNPKPRKELTADELFEELANDDRSPFTSAILSNETLSVVTKSGEYLTTYGATKELYNKVLATKTEDEIHQLMFPEAMGKKAAEELAKRLEEERSGKVQVTPKQSKDIDDNLQYLVDSGEFEVVEGEVFMKGIKVAMPKLMTYKFVELVKKVFAIDTDNLVNPHVTVIGASIEEVTQELEDEYQALRNFWMWCVNCPNPQSRNDLFKFLQNHDMKINKNGHFFAYRRVEKVASNQQNANYATFVSAEYLKIKKAKKGPKNFIVIQKDDILKVIKEDKDIEKGFDLVGNLAELYSNLSESQGQTFTDNYTHSMDIRIGKEVSMPRDKCDDNASRDCSMGLHIGNKNFGFSGFGDIHLLVLVNPMNAVSVPSYAVNKMRVCAYYPVAVIDRAEDETKFLEDANVLDLGNEYFADGMEKLEEMASKVSIKDEDKKIQINTTIDVLEEAVDMKAILAKRKVKA